MISDYSLNVGQQKELYSQKKQSNICTNSAVLAASGPPVIAMLWQRSCLGPACIMYAYMYNLMGILINVQQTWVAKSTRILEKLYFSFGTILSPGEILLGLHIS